MLDEARANLQEAIAPVMEVNCALAAEELQGQDVIREPVWICLGGVKRRDLVRHLRAHGCEFLREGGRALCQLALQSRRDAASEWVNRGGGDVGTLLLFLLPVSTAM